ncbi:MAG TPA: 1,4-dihydroxy-2-naphthoate polyprenyltransferase, partial [Haloplasmataceae bacterium]
NNICDIEDDIENKRYTLPIYIGKRASLILFRVLYYIGFLAIIIAIILRILPLTVLLSLLTIIIVEKHLKLFNQLQTKKDTFVLSVKNFVLVNISLVITIALGILIKIIW